MIDLKPGRARAWLVFFGVATASAVLTLCVSAYVASRLDRPPEIHARLQEIATGEIPAEPGGTFQGEIVAPQNNAVIYTDNLLIVLRKRKEGDIRLRLDGREIHPALIQSVQATSGRHRVEYELAGELEGSVEFTVEHDRVGHSPRHHIVRAPARIDLPPAVGSATPLRFRVVNHGPRTTDFRLHNGVVPSFRSRAELEAMLQRETAGMPASRVADYLMDFIAHWSAGRYVAPAYTPQDSEVLGYFRDWGYGWCSTRSYIFGELALMAGIPREGVRVISTQDSSHWMAETYFDNEWHLYDADLQTVFRKKDGGLLSAEEISTKRPRFFARSTDQFGFTLSGNYGDNYDRLIARNRQWNRIDPEVYAVDPPPFVLETGDTVEFFLASLGVRYCVDACASVPLVESRNPGTGILTRQVNDAEPAGQTAFTLPHAISGINVDIDSDRASHVTFFVTMKGTIEEATCDVGADTAAGHSFVDLTSCFAAAQQTGPIREVEVSWESKEGAIPSLRFAVYFQFSVRTGPWFDHDTRQLFVDGDGVNLDLDYEEMDVVDPVDRVVFTTLRDKPVVAGDGMGMIRLLAAPLRSDGRIAAGHHLSVVTTKPDLIDIIAPTWIGHFSRWPGWGTWTGPAKLDRQIELDRYATFFARSRGSLKDDAGRVWFSLMLDGKPAAQTAVEFVANPD